RGREVLLYRTVGGRIGSYFTTPDLTLTGVAWSPDSRYLAVAVRSTSVATAALAGLAVVDTRDGSERTIVRGRVFGVSFAPSLPDRVAFDLSSRSSGGVYAIAPDGSGRRRITHDGESPVWGPTAIAYDRSTPSGGGKDPVLQVWLIDPDGR